MHCIAWVCQQQLIFGSYVVEWPTQWGSENAWKMYYVCDAVPLVEI